MSVINKYPFINTLLGSLTSEQLKDLNDCINGQYEGSVVFRTLKSWGNSLLTESDKGIYPIQLELNGPAATTLPGYLVYTDNYCVLISYANDDACKLTIVNITMPETGSDIKWEYVSESLTVNELRSSLFDAAAGEGGGSGGTSFEEVEIKLYFSDFDVSTPLSPKLINAEKKAIIDTICNKCKNGSLIVGVLTTPTYSENSHTIHISGTMSNFNDDINEDYLCGFGYPSQFQQLDEPTYTVVLSKTGNNLTTLMNIPLPNDLFTLMATDTTKYVSLKFRVEK